MAHRLLTAFVWALAVPAAAQEAFTDARVRYLEPGAVLQRASEAGAEEAIPNMPFLPGDRAWTDGTGRAELQFADGTLLRLDVRYQREPVRLFRLLLPTLGVGGESQHVRFHCFPRHAPASTASGTGFHFLVINAVAGLWPYIAVNIVHSRVAGRMASRVR